MENGRIGIEWVFAKRLPSSFLLGRSPRRWLLAFRGSSRVYLNFYKQLIKTFSLE